MKKSIFYISFLFVTLMLSLTSCSKKPVEMEEVETVVKKVQSGSVSVGCVTDLIAYNIDSLITNCSDNKFLNEISSFKDIMECIHYERDSNLVGQNNWDFKASISPDGCNLEWNESSSIQQPIQINSMAEYEGDEKVSIGYFTNGCEIQITEKQTLTLLFFDLPIQGCPLYSMVWEYVEIE